MRFSLMDKFWLILLFFTHPLCIIFAGWVWEDAQANERKTSSCPGIKIFDIRTHLVGTFLLEETLHLLIFISVTEAKETSCGVTKRYLLQNHKNRFHLNMKGIHKYVFWRIKKIQTFKRNFKRKCYTYIQELWKEKDFILLYQRFFRKLFQKITIFLFLKIITGTSATTTCK